MFSRYLFYDLLIILRQQLLVDMYLLVDIVSCYIILTRCATSIVRGVVALFSQYPRSQLGSVILYGEVLYICREIISEFEFFLSFMEETVTRKYYVLVENQGQTCRDVVCFDFCHIDELV